LVACRKCLTPTVGIRYLCVEKNNYGKGLKMRKGIHPEYMECKVKCACGNEFEVKSNKPEMSIDICNECHPFFTGSEKIVDAAGRVEKFKNKYKLS